MVRSALNMFVQAVMVVFIAACLYVAVFTGKRLK